MVMTYNIAINLNDTSTIIKKTKDLSSNSKCPYLGEGKKGWLVQQKWHTTPFNVL